MWSLPLVRQKQGTSEAKTVHFAKLFGFCKKHSK
jgi:hypothetical protein